MACPPTEEPILATEETTAVARMATEVLLSLVTEEATVAFPATAESTVARTATEEV